jgi:H+/Cl- antiporter ClcA
LVGALAGLFGSFVSSVPLLILAILNKNPLGDMLSSTLMVALVLVVSIGLDTLLAALGGALVVKFTS